ncbi:uncharacterized protein LOC101450909 [Ceratitis capitata]|uniref:uncharacterized protein LOC101450909 n=1 Tax=Ceratitis capitata TaxID=7213 RepID=UPI000A0F64F7|nr:uncharacterized protein LOC101450909 [Ceratitis capitata]
MPTMTHVLERRRLQRYSLDNQLEVPSPRRIRHSLTSAANKENFDVHFTRSSFGHTSLTAFQDLSNGKSPIRVEYTPTRAALRYQTQTPNNVASRDNSLSSSRMGDVTLDRMLDAIIESARKDVQRVSAVRRMENGLPQTADSPVVVSDGEMSIHEMEVRTPTHLKRQRVVRRKNTKTTDTRRKVEAFEAVAAAQLTPPAPPPPQTQPLIGLTLPDGIPSPDTPLFKPSIASNIELLVMQTPPNATFIVDNNYVSSTAGGATNGAAELPQRCSTPTLVEEMPSIKRCLSFSSASDEEDDADFSNAAKRSSVASSNTSSTMGEHYCSGRASQNSYTKSAGPAAVRGNVELAINVERQQLNVHVIRCRDLQRPNGSTALNAYVKVALIRNEANSKPTENHFQRTAVHRHSSRPYFDHRFRFDLGAQEHVEPQAAGAAETVGDHLQLAVWHRDRQLK